MEGRKEGRKDGWMNGWMERGRERERERERGPATATPGPSHHIQRECWVPSCRSDSIMPKDYFFNHPIGPNPCGQCSALSSVMSACMQAHVPSVCRVEAAREVCAAPSQEIHARTHIPGPPSKRRHLDCPEALG